MASLFSSIAKYLPFTTKKMVGKDLAGNKFYEFPNPAGGRMKRVVKYRSMKKMNEYTTGQHRLPTWLSHTRADAPSITELQTDAARQSGLVSRISEIESREKEERIRQGYALPSDVDSKHASIKYGAPSRIRSTPSFGGAIPGPPPARSPTAPSPPQTQMPEALSSNRVVQEYAVPTPTSPRVPPPQDTVDPVANNDKDDLRRLAEEDTKRRIAEQGGETSTKDTGVQGVGAGGAGGGLQPRRRGR